MKLKEFIERGLLLDNNGKVFDEYGNEYRDENGEMQYLEEDDYVIREIIEKQMED